MISNIHPEVEGLSIQGGMIMKPINSKNAMTQSDDHGSMGEWRSHAAIALTAWL